MSEIHPQEAFGRLVSKEFCDAAFSDVETVVVAIWHGSFVPDVTELDATAARSAGYIIDKLMRFNCVSFEQKTKLRQTVLFLKSRCCVQPAASSQQCETLAKQWQLTSDLKRQVGQLLHLQTRNSHKS